ncbi:MAG: UDP-N-acetylmuramoyl-L-alanine--D-glutamate ligase [Chloroflexota bacterium]|nr:UDP-N-acetylmuramoyl-L-alanine--D-glutamate ligase [Chloroflexota bacterium]MDQ5867284.1 UDP-N-acetylmuramoyl-L-alanine--D-glutamate ligase [Chloroflexota bacterium]
MTPYSNKNVLVLGLGVHGGGLGVARYMGRNGANVRVTDLRTADKMQESIEALNTESFPVEYTLGEHRDEDFRWADVVVRNQAVPLTSPWVALARQLGKPVETEINIFMRLCPGPVLGVTGTKGKSSTATWTWEMLRHWRQDAVLAGNLRVSALEALERIIPETPVVLELSSFQTEGFEEPRISPHLAAVTNLSPDHLDRYRSMEEYGAAKKHIFLYQSRERGDYVVLNSTDPIVSGWAGSAPANVAWFGIGAATRRPGVYVQDGTFYWYAQGRERVLVGEASDLQVPGAHHLANASCAATLSILAGAPLEAVREGLRSFKGVADRQELLRTVRGVRFYNDTTSTTPTSTIAALNAIDGPVVLIAGGADKGLDFAELAPVVTAETVGVVLLEGTATDLMESQFREVGANILGRYSDFAEAVRAAQSSAPEDGAVLLSPGTASFGMFRNEFDRGEQFRAIVASLA